MTAVSSFRPLDECAEYRENQLRAKASWEKVFDKIVYFGKPDSRLASAKTQFVDEGEAFPCIFVLMSWGAIEPGWSCIINSDIVVDPAFAVVEKKLSLLHAQCAFSLRWQKDRQAPTFPPRITDMGLDIFCATREVWSDTAAHVPTRFRLGKILWDTWLLQYWAHHYLAGCYDFTPSKVIFHPLHEHRKDQSMTTPEDDAYMKKAIWPANLIEV
jgi:hypothetical protein